MSKFLNAKRSITPLNSYKVEATSSKLIDGISASVYSAYKFMTWRVPEEEITKILSKWALEVIHLSLHVTPVTLILSFLKLLNEWIDVYSVFQQCIELFKKTLEFINNKFSKQPETEIVEATSFDLASLSNVQYSIPALTASLASISVVFATLILGKNISDIHKNKSLTEKVADTMMCVTKIKSGIASVNEIIKDFSKYVYECMFDLVGLDEEDKLITLIRSSEVQDTAEFTKKKIFEYTKFLTDPVNLTVVQGNKHYRDQLDFVYNVLSSIRYQLANSPVSIDNMAMNYINNIYVEVKRIRQSVSKSMSSDTARFCPWWLNLVGGSHTGKSTFTSILTKYMVKALRQYSIELGIDLELPTAEEELFYNVNFCDKYETNYRGQYFTIIDDFAQDNNVQDINSGLKLITWCSNIPCATNQAAIADKGTPFTSKIIISTSNDMSLGNRKEIIDKNALINRICKSYKFVKDYNSVPHPWFPKPISIYEYKFGQYVSDADKQNLTPEFVIAECCRSYIEWFRKEKKIERLRDIDDSRLESILFELRRNTVEPTFRTLTQTEIENDQIKRSLFPYDYDELISFYSTEQIELIFDLDALEFNEQAFNEMLSENPVHIGYNSDGLPMFWAGSSASDSEDSYDSEDSCDSFISVEPTSRSIKCRIGLTPNIKSNGFDCDCEDHSERNRVYQNWVTMMNTEINILDFEENFSEITQHNDYLLNRFKSAWNRVKLYLTDFVKSSMFKVIAGAGAVYVTYCILNNKSSVEEVVETNKSYSNTPKRRLPRRNLVNNNPVQATSFEVEATNGFANISDMFSNTISSNAMEVISNSIIKNGNVCLLKSPYKANTGIRIEGNAILTNNHFLTSMINGDRLIVEYCIRDASPQKYEQTFNSKRVYRIPNTDLAVYKCDYSIPNCKSIVKHFPTQSLRGNHKQALVVTADPIPTVFTNIIATPNTHKSKYVVDDIEYDTLDSFSTNCPVQKGMSGSMLFSLDKMDQHKILGIQTCRNVSGLNSYGYFKPVTQQELKDALNYLQVDSFHNDVESIVEETCANVNKICPPNLKNGNLTYLGGIPKHKQIKAQLKTKIERSCIYDANKETQQPSILNDYDERLPDDLYGKSVIFRSIEGFNQPNGRIDTQTLESATQQLIVERDVVLDIPGIPRRTLTTFECINGVPDLILPINMKTSPGYPYVLQRKNTTIGGKYEWFVEQKENLPQGYGKIYEPTPNLLSGMEQAEQQLIKGIMPNFLAYCCLKDETRLMDKINAGKTRAFICLPLHYGILVRKYCGAYVAAMKKKAGIISSCVGIDPAKQWSLLYDKLRNKNSEWEDFDYSNWDQHLHGELIMQIAEVMNQWYNDGEINCRIRRMLFYFLVHTPIIVKDRIFIKSQGQCSGCPITAELNCEVHDLLMLYVWIKFHNDRNIQTDLTEMRENLALCIYGDDIITSLDSSYELDFCGTNIKEYMKDLGMHITPGDKKSTIFETKTPDKIFFLKRNFVRDGENILAPLRKDIIENIFQWVHKSDDMVHATTENCKTALREAFMHRRTYFNELMYEINSRIKRLNINANSCVMQPIVMDYDQINATYICGSYACAGLEPAMLATTDMN